MTENGTNGSSLMCVLSVGLCDVRVSDHQKFWKQKETKKKQKMAKVPEQCIIKQNCDRNEPKKCWRIAWKVDPFNFNAIKETCKNCFFNHFSTYLIIFAQFLLDWSAQ